jgi:hypothetical protein
MAGSIWMVMIHLARTYGKFGWVCFQLPCMSTRVSSITRVVAFQQALDLWEEGIHRATGGAIVLEKSHWYLLDSKYSSNNPSISKVVKDTWNSLFRSPETVRYSRRRRSMKLIDDSVRSRGLTRHAHWQRCELVAESLSERKKNISSVSHLFFEAECIPSKVCSYALSRKWKRSESDTSSRDRWDRRR